MRPLTGLIWIGPFLMATACGASSQNAGSGGSGNNDNSSSSGAPGSGSSASGATVAASGANISASGSASSGSPQGSGASSGTASGNGQSGSNEEGSGASSGGAGGSGEADDSDAARSVEPPSLDCPNGCNTDASYPSMTPLLSSTPTPIGDQTLPRKLYIENQCTYTIWTLTGNNAVFPGGPLKTDPGESFVVGWSNGFSGRIWPRSGCTGNGTGCTQTGNDTLAEFTLTAGMASDWYDISLVDGFTIPLAIIQMSASWTPSPTYVPGGPLGADQECGSPVCAIDMNPNCPASQQEKDGTGHIWGCKNGQSGNGGHSPTDVTSYLKAGCPTSYTYPYDDPQSLFLCLSAAQNGGTGAKDYKIIYCPTQGSTPGFP